MAEPNLRVHADVAELARVARDEMRRAVHAPRGLGGVLDAALTVPAGALARSLAQLDDDIAEHGLPVAARLRLRGYGVEARWEGPQPRKTGPLVVVSNHPGLFDALALFTAIGRDDLSTLAAARPLFEVLPNLRRRLAFIPEGAASAFALRGAARHLTGGGALLHFPAGQIEPDPDVAPRHASPVSVWKPGLELLLSLARRRAPGTVVVAALVSGVTSRRARRLAMALSNRPAASAAIVPLVQLTLPGFSDLDLRVRFASARGAGDPGVVEALRGDLQRLAGRPS